MGDYYIMCSNKLLKHILRHPIYLRHAYDSIISDKREQTFCGWRKVLLGKSSNGEPIVAFEKQVNPENPKLVVLAGQHGNEPASIAAAFALLLLSDNYKWVLPHRFWRSKSNSINIYLVPVANPDGLISYLECIEHDPTPIWHNTCSEARYNSRSADINRDWMFLIQDETKILHEYITRIKPDIVLDLHEFYASGGSPPKWSTETEGFDTTLTDAPYAMVDEIVSETSREVMDYVSKTLKRLMGRKIRERHFTGSDKPYPPPSILGAHLPLEYYPKLLVETWGVGLHGFLWRERVVTHLVAIYSVIEYLESYREKISELRSRIHELDNKTPGYLYYIECSDVCYEISELLSIHGIRHEIRGGNLVVYPVGRGEVVADILFDKSCKYNRVLEENGYGRHTIDLLYPGIRIKKQFL